MTLDRRVRTALEDGSAGVPLHVERSLEAVQRRRRHQVIRHRVALGAALAGLAVAVPLTVRAVLPGTHETPTPAGGTSAMETLAGDYRSTITAADSTGVTPSVAGTWSLHLGADGRVQVEAPDGFAGERQPTGVTFIADASTWRTDLYRGDFCPSLGAYGWQRTGTQLRLIAQSDTCAVRRAILGSEPWIRTG
jgi:hypothetical protein